jgi:transcriptional regulator with XRE-family HTH domain
MKHLPPDVSDLPSLVRWIRDTYHKGKTYPISKRVGISAALADHWAHGTVKSPSVITTMKLCAAYKLPVLEVMGLITDEREKRKLRAELKDAQDRIAFLTSELDRVRALVLTQGPSTS